LDYLFIELLSLTWEPAINLFNMPSNQFLLYGANGYTGRLIASLAKTYGLEPVLAGRDKDAIKAMAEALHLPYRIGNLNEPEMLRQLLKDMPLVLHAAGPFEQTALPMIKACLANGTHYLDITGEIPVFEMAKTFSKAAFNKGLMLMPGVGFDVVPTDCLALFLKERLPDACSLQLAFASLGGGLSHGTATTMANNLGTGSAVRENGKIVLKPLGHKRRQVDFGQKKMFVMSIPWGDISTAFHTTGIPNIETYTTVPPFVYRLLKFQRLFNWALRTAVVRNYVKKKINKKIAGPTQEQRAGGQSLVWGEVQNAEGKSLSAVLSGPDGYTLTAHSSLIIAKKVLSGNLHPGYQTPGSAYGADLILEVPGTQRNAGI